MTLTAAQAFPFRGMHFFASIEKAKRDVPDWMPKFSMLEGLRNLEFAEVIQLMFFLLFPGFLQAYQTQESRMTFFYSLPSSIF